MNTEEKLAKLRRVVNYACRTFPLYHSKLHELGLTPLTIRSTEDFAKLPFLAKTNLMTACTVDALASQPLYLVGFTTGTTARPAPVFTTHADFRKWESILAEALAMLGVGARDTVQITFGRCGIGCIVLLGAVRMLRAAAIPFDVDLVPPEQLLTHLDEFRVSTLLTFPSIAKRLSALVEGGQARRPQHLVRICLMGESWSELVRDSIQRAFGASVYDIYGSTDTGLVGIECHAQDGLHIPEDHVFVEIVDPKTGQPSPLGRDGEIVVTLFWKQAVPIIRYRTGDIASWLDGECSCGLSTARLSRIKGRYGELITIGSCKAHPTGLEEALMASHPNIENWQVLIIRDEEKDKLIFVVETETEVDCESLRSKLYTNLNKVNEDLVALIRSGIVHPLEVKAVKPGTITRKAGKILKIRDTRRDVQAILGQDAE